ncbi:sensor histidine kinase [Oharaeibacter diazotrophicus]|uniref:histidine kinase n=2 Tax=Oharaeibacter diazotrophicus TaxID=1920512 RepID=A0A4R6RCV7_9HYPH|nr:HAMP domain-containing sensor histidine kinase [Oharaeibacter diazotrophicus]TDP83914.1 signal transduction histidine kinase /histidine kinase [Oharaeibacter diazotrophicus]BBE72956.1 nitrogen regulation protein NR(II) [Pleomorphomonas sp. SM30]GLS74735.1 ATPase [Oharaeibacter diazotrophicus]
MDEGDSAVGPDELDGAGGRQPVGLSFKLLVLTVLFVMLAEVMIYVPSIANFQKTEIEDRLHSATIAAHAMSALEPGATTPQLQTTLLRDLDVSAIAVRQHGMKRLVAMADEMPGSVERDVQMRTQTPMIAIRSAFDTLVYGGDRMIRATGAFDGDGEIEIVFSEAGLREAMLLYSRNILLLSVVISTFSAVLVYLSLRRLFVRPMQRIGLALARWAEDPEDPNRILVPTNRRDEFGLAEEQLADMQAHVQEVLKQQRRLADLGLAVSKINHDLRNLLASAQLVSDRLTAIPDPTVQRFAPKLIGALDRAISYAEAVLAYGKAQEAPPARRLLKLARLAAEVGDITGVAHHATIEWAVDVPADLEVDADGDQLFRVLLNLVRNAAQALEQAADESAVRRLVVAGERVGTVVRIRVADTGPGVPDRAREHLFKPFQGSVRRGGTGLGLAIAAELVRAHGGSIALLDDGPGAVFEIEIPDRPVALADVRRSRA